MTIEVWWQIKIMLTVIKDVKASYWYPWHTKKDSLNDLYVTYWFSSFREWIELLLSKVLHVYSLLNIQPPLLVCLDTPTYLAISYIKRLMIHWYRFDAILCPCKYIVNIVWFWFLFLNCCILVFTHEV